MRPFQRLTIDRNQLAINSASVTARSIGAEIAGEIRKQMDECGCAIYQLGGY
jgi:hypothetical protein